MKKSRFGGAFAVLCLLLCVIPVLGMAVFGPSEAGANERLSPAPSLRGKDGVNTAFLPELADYVSDHFFLRQELITLRSGLASLLGGSTSEKVIPGKDGWLYYADTLADYTGTGTLSDPELRAAARNLFLMAEYCEGRGIRFLFVPVPNKNSLYPEHMPSLGLRAEEHDVQRLFPLLAELGVPTLDLFSVFDAREETLYFAHDSHWNSRGAALAADAVSAAFGRPSDYASGSFSGSVPHTGDLFEMLYPAGRDRETDPVPDRPLRYSRTGSDTRPDSITIDTAGEGSGVLLAFRDSFGNALFPYLADSFASARFSRQTAYDLTAAGELGADHVLVELVERNLSYLLRYLPVMPAPEREEAVPGSSSGSLELARKDGAKGPEGCVLWSGTLPEGGCASPVILICSGNAYEAFAQLEGGFAAYLPEGETPEWIRVGPAESAVDYTVTTYTPGE